MSSAATLSAAHLERAAYVYIRQSSESPGPEQRKRAGNGVIDTRGGRSPPGAEFKSGRRG